MAIEEGKKVKEGVLIAEWDPYTIPILTEVPGWVKFGDITEGVTMQEQVDEVTGHAHKVIIESKELDLRPRISIKQERVDAEGKKVMETEARYILPVGSNIYVKEGERVEAGDVLVKIPRETTKTKDITGGLPRVAELFEARRPKEYALISEIDGAVVPAFSRCHSISRPAFQSQMLLTSAKCRVARPPSNKPPCRLRIRIPT